MQPLSTRWAGTIVLVPDEAIAGDRGRLVAFVQKTMARHWPLADRSFWQVYDNLGSRRAVAPRLRVELRTDDLPSGSVPAGFARTVAGLWAARPVPVHTCLSQDARPDRMWNLTVTDDRSRGALLRTGAPVVPVVPR